MRPSKWKRLEGCKPCLTHDCKLHCCDHRYLTNQETAASETAAVMLEPVQGEGGYVVPPPGFMEGVRDFCDKHRILMIADEIQSGVFAMGHVKCKLCETSAIW